jgi:diguanylate cyclase (GGDEF)-like protein
VLPMGDRTAPELARSLGRAPTVELAADAAVHHLAAVGVPRPSLYLEQAGRLRCLAQRGCWQVRDGIPRDAGVIGRSFVSGQTVEVTDARDDEAFPSAIPDVRQQVAVPLRWRDEVVGVLNAESRDALPAGARAALAAAAAAFERRLDQLGGPPGESVAQRLARLVTALTERGSETDIRRGVLDAAVEITAIPTAAVIAADAAGGARVSEAVGPLAGALESLEPYELGQLDASVGCGASLVTTGMAGSRSVTIARLREAGVSTLVVVPMSASGHHLGSLVVAGVEGAPVPAPVVPMLEILAAQAATSVLAVRTVEELRRRAQQDPLTELGHHASFHAALRSRLTDRRRDRPLAVIVVDVDDFKGVNDRYGHQGGDRLLRLLSADLSRVLRDEDLLYRIGGDEFATILEVRSMDEAREVARRMVEAARGGPTTVSVGVALATPDEAADALVDRADAAMYAAKSAGRDTIGVASSAVTDRLW